ncbi:MAG: Ldh family oxidoreductase [Arenicellales bacterium]
MTIEQALALATRALIASGADPAPAESVARSVVAAHAMDRLNVGLEHLPYYCDALRRGAVNGRVEPEITRVKPGLLAVDAHSGFAHYAFDQALEKLTSMVDTQGAAVMTIRNTYTCGALGYFPERLARLGFAAIAATNAGPAAVAASGARRPVFSTNPIAFALPREAGPPLVIDQSTSACTLVDVRAAQDRGESIPGDWALDRDGRPTEDPAAALEGSFKAFGGYKGSNIALLVELLAAGLAGANWSMDAPSFAEGSACPDVGQWMLAMDLEVMGGGTASKRIDAFLLRLASLGCHIPGRERLELARKADEHGISLTDELYERIRSCGDPV